jgi:predicted DNA-binding protein
MDTNSKTQISLRIDEEMLKRLKTRSVKNMRTVSGQVLKYIELGLHMDEGLVPGSM